MFREIFNKMSVLDSYAYDKIISAQNMLEKDCNDIDVATKAYMELEDAKYFLIGRLMPEYSSMVSERFCNGVWSKYIGDMPFKIYAGCVVNVILEKDRFGWPVSEVTAKILRICSDYKTAEAEWYDVPKNKDFEFDFGSPVNEIVDIKDINEVIEG